MNDDERYFYVRFVVGQMNKVDVLSTSSCDISLSKRGTACVAHFLKTVSVSVAHIVNIECERH